MRHYLVESVPPAIRGLGQIIGWLLKAAVHVFYAVCMPS